MKVKTSDKMYFLEAFDNDFTGKCEFPVRVLV